MVSLAPVDGSAAHLAARDPNGACLDLSLPAVIVDEEIEAELAEVGFCCEAEVVSSD